MDPAGAPVWLSPPIRTKSPDHPTCLGPARASVGSRRTRDGSRESFANASLPSAEAKEHHRKFFFPSWSLPDNINQFPRHRRPRLWGPVLRGQALCLPRAEYCPGRSTVLAGSPGNGWCVQTERCRLGTEEIVHVITILSPMRGLEGRIVLCRSRFRELFTFPPVPGCGSMY